MKTDKNKLIEEFLALPIKRGDTVIVKGLGIQNKNDWGNSTPVIKALPNGDIHIQQYGYRETTLVKKCDYKKYTDAVGYNPMVKKPWNSELRIVAFSLQSILLSVGFDKRNRKMYTEKFGEVEVEEMNWNPFVIDNNGNEVMYQRDFVWSLENKQNLIESIYNNIDIGKIVVRKRSYEWVRKRVQAGKVAHYKDIVDGKQRLSSIIDFCSNKFPDKAGFYWDDLSKQAKRHFEQFSCVAYGELGEQATDADVKSVFLGVNFTGVPMSNEQIEFVKSINL